jgi:hypothetical protein
VLYYFTNSLLSSTTFRLFGPCHFEEKQGGCPLVDLAKILHSVCYTSVISKCNDIVILLLRCIYVFLMMMTTVMMMTMMMAIMMMTTTMTSSDAPDI